jgi:hypothetical protein
MYTENTVHGIKLYVYREYTEISLPSTENEWNS